MIWKLKERQQKLLEGEKGTIIKDWGGKTRIALAFPNRYAVGMSNLGLHFVYEALNRFENIVCERVFYPEPQDLAVIRQSPGACSPSSLKGLSAIFTWWLSAFPMKTIIRT